MNERVQRAYEAQRRGGPKVGKIPVADAQLAEFAQDAEYEERPVWRHDGFEFEVLGAEQSSIEGVRLLIVVPMDGGPHG